MTAFQDPTGGAEQVLGSPFAAIETLYDPETIRLLYARGIDESWRCLEVGGGGGSLVKWLCQRVGKYGRVVVTDLDVSHLRGIEEPNLEIDQHDIVTDPIPENVFHLVHARLVLGELKDRDLALQRMSTMLRSGGWIVIEELDRTSQAPDSDDATSAALFEKFTQAVSTVLISKGLDPHYGRRVYRRLGQLGLVDAVARGGSVVGAGGSPAAEVLRQETAALREDLISARLLAKRELEAVDALLTDPNFAFSSATMVTTWARRASPL